MEHSNPTQNPCDHGLTGTGNGDGARTYERFQILKILHKSVAIKTEMLAPGFLTIIRTKQDESRGSLMEGKGATSHHILVHRLQVSTVIFQV